MGIVLLICGIIQGIEDSNGTWNYIAYLHADSMKGWCEEIFNFYWYSHDGTYFHLVLCSLLWYFEPRPVTRRSSCWPHRKMHRTGFTQIWPLFVVQSTLPTNLFLHGMSCDTLISHPSFLGKTAVGVRGRGLTLPAFYGLGNKWLAACHSGVRSQRKSLLPDAPLGKGLGSNSPCHFTF